MGIVVVSTTISDGGISSVALPVDAGDEADGVAATLDVVGGGAPAHAPRVAASQTGQVLLAIPAMVAPPRARTRNAQRSSIAPA